MDERHSQQRTDKFQDSQSSFEVKTTESVSLLYLRSLYPTNSQTTRRKKMKFKQIRRKKTLFQIDRFPMIPELELKLLKRWQWN